MHTYVTHARLVCMAMHAAIAAAWKYTSEVKVVPRHHVRNDYMIQ